MNTYGYTTGEVSGTPTTESFAYSETFGDRLVSFKGQSITYNSLGCPVSYGVNTLTWNKGKLLTFRSGNPIIGFSTNTFTYNAYGQRTRKVYQFTEGRQAQLDYLATETNEYTYDHNGRLIRETCTDNYKSSASIYRELIYLYDESGIIGVVYNYNNSNTQAFYYHRNLQGDVISIFDKSGVRKAEYAYDAYGNCEVIYSASDTDIAEINPIRYRGYYYDRRTKLYYLNSRYYNPEWRRFISPDDTSYLDPESVNGLNLYCYCNNDPVNYADPSGHSVIVTSLILISVFATAGLGYAAYSDYSDDNDINGSIGWQKYAASAIAGGAIGFGIGYFGPSILSFLGSSFSFTLPSFGALNMGGALALVGGTTITVTGAQLLGGAVATAGIGIMLFSKGFGPRMGHNQHEKQMWNEAMHQLGINDKDLISRLHYEVHKYPYQDKLKGLLKVLREILAKWGKL